MWYAPFQTVGRRIAGTPPEQGAPKDDDTPAVHPLAPVCQKSSFSDFSPERCGRGDRLVPLSFLRTNGRLRAGHGVAGMTDDSRVWLKMTSDAGWLARCQANAGWFNALLVRSGEDSSWLHSFMFASASNRRILDSCRPQDVVVTGGIVRPTVCACARQRQGASLRSAPASRGSRP